MENFYSTNSDDITRAYLDSLMFEPRYLDTDLPSLKMELFGETFDTPIMTAALSHLHAICDNAMSEIAAGAKASGAVHWYGMGEDAELESIVATGARTVKIIKPHANDETIYQKIEHAAKTGVFALGMDIDHSICGDGTYDICMGLPMKPKTTEQLKSFIEASPVPFIVKGVLSVKDAEKCVEAGAAGILLSHHHNIMSCMVPPLMQLPAILEAVDGAIPVFVDCGIQSGMDVFKALALGAKAVCIGRGFMDPLKEGSAGVAAQFKKYNGELAAVMARSGCKSLEEIEPSILHHRTF